MLEQYPNDVKLVFKNFPLRNHQQARPAALAALAAGEQGKFWEYHDLVFKDFRQLDDGKLVALADQLGLDRARFDADRKGQKLAALITRDTREGQQVGVRGTPTIFVNGRILAQRSLEGFRAAIEPELAKARAKQ